MFLISTGCGMAVDRCTELQHDTKSHIFFSREKQYFLLVISLLLLLFSLSAQQSEIASLSRGVQHLLNY